MLALKPPGCRQAADISAHGVLLAACQEAYRRAKTCSGNIQALLLDTNAELGASERRQRSAAASRAYESARADWLAASARLNEYLIAHIVASAPTVAEAPDAFEEPGALQNI